ncbi:15772_t:CDS:2, partial [Acaulospora morrowiae]
MNYSLDSYNFGAKYKEDYQESTGKEIRAAHKEYKVFYTKHHRNHPGVTTDCYAEFLGTLGKQEEQRGEEFECCYWFVLYCKRERGSWDVVSWAELDRRDITEFVVVMKTVPQRIVGMHYKHRHWEKRRKELSKWQELYYMEAVLQRIIRMHYDICWGWEIEQSRSK